MPNSFLNSFRQQIFATILDFYFLETPSLSSNTVQKVLLYQQNYLLK